MRERARRVAIVGGGASGTLTAVHLLRGGGGPLEIVLLDAAGSFGAGVAYGTQEAEHLLNVPAVRMGGIAGRPDHFHEWLSALGRPVDPAEFVPRSFYGEYLRAQLEDAIRTNPTAHLIRLPVEVRALVAGSRSDSQVRLTLADGNELIADQVVLAVGPLPGGDPVPVPGELSDSGAYITDPWRDGALERAKKGTSVLIIGTGLTMVDVALSLTAGTGGPRILAVSRNGLLPRPHRRELTRVEELPLPTYDVDVTLERIAFALLSRVATVSQEGGDWRDVVDSVRPLVPRLWRALSIAEKRHFLADLQRLWEVHRFRVAPAGADRLESLRRADRLRVEACAVTGLEPRPGGVRAWLDGGGTALDPADVDLVVNCSGAGAAIRRSAPPLIAGMLADGTARPDALGLGLDVDPDGTLLAAAGTAQPSIHIVGALRKGVEWEATSVTEIREQAAVVAQAIGAGFSARTPSHC